jgi:hypothetical protein
MNVTKLSEAYVLGTWMLRIDPGFKYRKAKYRTSLYLGIFQKACSKILSYEIF